MLLDVADLTLERPAPAGEAGFGLTLDRFTLEPGSLVAVTGPSGSGKSTLIELLALLLRPTRVGRFVLDGADLAKEVASGDLDRLARIRSGIFAYAPQNGGLLPFLTVRENASLAARLSGKPQEGLAARIETEAKRLGLRARLDEKPARLSGGERCRASLLRAMATEARIVIADEPTAALDRGTADSTLSALIDAVAAMGAALICVSHDVALMRRRGFELVEVMAVEDAKGVRRANVRPCPPPETTPDEGAA